MFHNLYLYLKRVLQIGAAIAIAVIVTRNVFIDVGKVNGKSMEHTYLDQTLFLVNRIGLLVHEPRRGDVVQFFDPHPQTKELLIKRVIGLPGERVKISQNVVSILSADGTEVLLDEPYLDTDTTTQTASHDTVIFPVIPEHSFFLLGDNRDESVDSRYFGVIHRSLITGSLIPLPQL